MFRLTFFGTASGVPTKERNVSGLAVECIANPYAKSASWILVDCGEGTQYQLLKSHLFIGNLSAILITHLHGDHCYGLAGLLASMGMHARKKPLTLIAPKALAKLLDTLTLISDLTFDYPINFIAIEDVLGDDDVVLSFSENHHIHIKIHELSHRMPSYGFEMTQILHKKKLLTDKLTDDGIANHHWRQILASQKTLHLDGKAIVPTHYVSESVQSLKIVVAGDNDTPELLKKAVVDCRLLVHEATFTDEILGRILAREKEQGGYNPQHSSVKMVAQFAQKYAIPHLVLTHFSARFASFEDLTAKQPNMAHVRQEARAYYDGGLILAKDFMSVVVDDDGEVVSG